MRCWGFIALMAPDIIRMIFGPQWDETAPIASVLAVSLMPVHLVILGNNVLIATGHVKRRMHIVMLYTPVHMLAVLLAAQIGLLSVAAIWAVNSVLYAWLHIRHLKQVLDASAAELLQPCLSSLIVAGVCIASEAAALVGARHLQLWPLASIVLVFLAGAGAWMATARALDHAAADEATRLWRHFPARPEHDSPPATSAAHPTQCLHMTFLHESLLQSAQPPETRTGKTLARSV